MNHLRVLPTVAIVAVMAGFTPPALAQGTPAGRARTGSAAKKPTPTPKTITIDMDTVEDASIDRLVDDADKLTSMAAEMTRVSKEPGVLDTPRYAEFYARFQVLKQQTEQHDLWKETQHAPIPSPPEPSAKAMKEFDQAMQQAAAQQQQMEAQRRRNAQQQQMARRAGVPQGAQMMIPTTGPVMMLAPSGELVAPGAPSPGTQVTPATFTTAPPPGAPRPPDSTIDSSVFERMGQREPANP